MTPIPLTRFPDPTILTAITAKHLARFFDQFRFLLLGRNLPLPAAHELPGTEAYYDCWSKMLQAPESLPDALVEALLAIEELAAPKNRLLLDAKLEQNRPANPWLDPSDPPEGIALQLWLIFPYKFIQGELTTAPAVSPAASRLPSTGSPRPSDGRGARGEGDHQPSTPQQSTKPVLPSIKIDSD